MRISDWSSDVCSSDLTLHVWRVSPCTGGVMAVAIVIALLVLGTVIFHLVSPWWMTPLASNWGSIDKALIITLYTCARSEERRGGEECVSQCRSRWSQDHQTKKKR